MGFPTAVLWYLTSWGILGTREKCFPIYFAPNYVSIKYTEVEKKTNFDSDDDDIGDDDDDNGDVKMTIFPLYSVKICVFTTYAET